FALLVVVGVLIMMALTDPRLMVAVVLILAVATCAGERAGKRLPALRRLIQLRGALLAGRLQESIAGMRTIQAFGAEAKELTRLDGLNDRIRTADKYNGLKRALTTPLWETAELLGIVLVLWYGGHLLASGQISVGSFVAFIAYMELLASPVSKVGGDYFPFQTSPAGAPRVAAPPCHNRLPPAPGGPEGPPDRRARPPRDLTL